MAKAFNKKELQSMVDMLRTAQRSIESEKRGALCPALWRQVPEESGSRYELVEYLTDWIGLMLVGNIYLEGWLMNKRHIRYGTVSGSCWQHRIAWIDWMVAELESEVRALDAAAAEKLTSDERFRIAA